MSPEQRIEKIRLLHEFARNAGLIEARLYPSLFSGSEVQDITSQEDRLKTESFPLSLGNNILGLSRGFLHVTKHHARTVQLAHAQTGKPTPAKNLQTLGPKDDYYRIRFWPNAELTTITALPFRGPVEKGIDITSAQGAPIPDEFIHSRHNSYTGAFNSSSSLLGSYFLYEQDSSKAAKTFETFDALIDRAVDVNIGL